MKGYGKKVFALMIAAIFALSTPLVAMADNEVLITKKETTDSPEETKLVFDMSGDKPKLTSVATADMTLHVKRESDTFNVLQIAYVDWVEKNISGQTVVNAEIKWVPELETWMMDNGYTKTVDSATKAMEPKDFGIAQKEAGNDNNVVRLLDKILADTTLMGKLRENYKAAYHSITAEGTSEDSVITGTYKDPSDPLKLNTLKQGGVTATLTNTGKVNFSGYYEIKDLQYGIYMVEATAKDRDYQPLMFDLVPEQTGPTGNWYMTENVVATLKYEDVSIDKQVNPNKDGLSKSSGGDYDIVGTGEIVDFTIEIQVPRYPLDEKATTDAGKPIYKATLFNGYDIMEGGYDLIPTSAKITYKDANGNILHPQASINFDALGNMTATDQSTGHPITYTAILGTNAFTYYDTTKNEDVNLYSVTNSSFTTFYGKINGKLVSVGTSKSEAINKYNELLRSAGYSQITSNAAVIMPRVYEVEDAELNGKEVEVSFISCEWNYTNLMTSLQYAAEDKTGGSMIYAEGDSADNHKTSEVYDTFVPDKVYITYSAMINAKNYIGTDDNENYVEINYVKDTGTGTESIERPNDTTKVWTYAANIVKVDGSTLGTNGTARVDESGNPVLDEEGNPIYDPTYLEGAIFDLYQLDTEYCGATTSEVQTAKPSDTDYGKYGWYRDKNTNLASYAAAEADWGMRIQNIIQYHNTSRGITNADTIRAAVRAVLPSTVSTVKNPETGADVSTGKGWATADKFDNKYEPIIKDTNHYNDFYNPKLSDGLYDSIAVAEKVSACDNCQTEHYHIYYYMIIRDKIVSTKTAQGVTVNGLDEGTYLLVETAPPTGYNELSDAIQFEIHAYDESQATLAAGGKSYKGFIADHEEGQEGKNIEDGIYRLQVQNFKGLELPSTGGMGTLLFTIIGIVIMSGAFILVFVKGRKNRAYNS